MKYSEDEKYPKDNHSTPSKELKSNPHDGFHIGSLDFVIWTIVPLIGIIFCLIHTEQGRLWKWIGDTPAEAQSFEAKTIVSVISAIIGGCVAAMLLKTVKTVSFTIIKYKGVGFSQLATIIGGFSLSNVPMLSAGNGWLSIIIITLLLVISTITKQLAVVSMTVSPNFTSVTESQYTRNYTQCMPTTTVSEFSRLFPILSLQILNSVLNQNASYTNEYYDRGIPGGLKGISNVERILPFANASCIKVPRQETFNYLVPTFIPLPSTKFPTIQSAWSTNMTIIFDNRREKETPADYLNCTIFIGYATASTSCNNTLCETHRTSEITPYEETNMGLPDYMTRLFDMLKLGSSSVNPLHAWLAGGSLTSYYEVGRGISGESLETIEKNSAILATIIGRVICDSNMGEHLADKPALTQFNSYLEYRDYYIYHVLWKWPFWLVIALIAISWLICMFTMWITPESRVMSVEWLLSQYIARDKWGYISGRDLANAHEGSLFQVIDQKPDNEVGNIVITKIDVQSDIRNKKIRHRKRYQ